MKPITILFSLVLLLASITVNAQSLSTKVSANIPFSFVVGSNSLPAGEYDLGNRNLPRNVLVVQNIENFKSLAGLTQPLYKNGGAKETCLIFNRYKDDTGDYIYFLSQVWIVGENSGVEFVKSRVEREAAKRAIKRDMITLVVPTKPTTGKAD
ncbi:MAG TPA: hypothetical protein VFZ34_12905 [Blastocatellia bacterium]|nr:hypothetical protein [Blastocatellia bacterium]